jgi:hypothetical protein
MVARNPSLLWPKRSRSSKVRKVYLASRVYRESQALRDRLVLQVLKAKLGRLDPQVRLVQTALTVKLVKPVLLVRTVKPVLLAQTVSLDKQVRLGRKVTLDRKVILARMHPQ